MGEGDIGYRISWGDFVGGILSKGGILSRRICLGDFVRGHFVLQPFMIHSTTFFLKKEDCY